MRLRISPSFIVAWVISCTVSGI